MPLRLMILQSSHIFFTDALTFMGYSCDSFALFVAWIAELLSCKNNKQTSP